MTYFSNSFSNPKKVKKIVSLTDNTFTPVQVSTTNITYPGTLLDYTPEHGSNSVIFECSTQITWQPDANESYGEFSLQYSTDNGLNWYDFQNCQIFQGQYSPYSDRFSWTNTWSFVVDSWSGQRKIRISTRSYQSSGEFTAGGSYSTYPNNSLRWGSMTHVLIYSVL